MRPKKFIWCAIAIVLVVLFSTSLTAFAAISRASLLYGGRHSVAELFLMHGSDIRGRLGKPLGGTGVDGEYLFGGSPYDSFNNIAVLYDGDYDGKCECLMASPSAITMNGNTLDRNRKGLARILGEPICEDDNRNDEDDGEGLTGNFTVQFLVAEGRRKFLLSFEFDDLSQPANLLIIYEREDSNSAPVAAPVASPKFDSLFTAAKRGTAQDIETMLKAGADVNMLGGDGWTPLMQAARWNKSVEVVKALLAAGADINIGIDTGLTALSLAEKNNTPEVVSVLREAAAQANSAQAAQAAQAAKHDDANAALFKAVENGTVADIKAALEAGADVNASNKDLWTPLMVAARYNHSPMVIQTLLEAGANRKARRNGQTAQSIASKYNSPEVVAVLNGEPVKLSIFDAVMGNNVDDLREILANSTDSADVNVRDEKENWTPLMFAAVYGRSAEIIEMLVEAGADVDARDEINSTPLVMAASDNESAAVTEALLKAGADVNTCDNKLGMTPLMFAAVRNKSTEVIHALIKAGADVNADKDGMTALMYAASLNPSGEIITALVEAGAGIATITSSNVASTDVSVVNIVTGDINAKFDGEVVLNALANTPWADGNEQLTAVTGLTSTDIHPRKDITVLMLAAMVNSSESVIKALLKAGTEPDARDVKDRTALMYAAGWTPNPEVIDALLAGGSDLNAVTDHGWQPLMYAANYNSSIPVLEALIKAGADVNACPLTYTPLMLAAQHSHSGAVIETLVKAGAKVNEGDILGRSALDMARERKDADAKEVLDALLAAGASSLLDDFLFYSIVKEDFTESDVTGIKLLLLLGADANAKNDEGWTPLMAAARYNKFPAVIETLVEASADVNAQKNDKTTALMLAVGYSSSLEVTETLIKASADVNARDEDGETPLMYAVRYNTSSVIEALAKAGAEVNVTNKIGATALVLAAVNNSSSSKLETLVKVGADVNLSDDKGRTPLMYAAAASSAPSVIETLVKLGANRNARDEDGITPLMYAAMENKSVEIMDALIKAGVNLNLGNKNDHTARYLAEVRNTAEVIDTLIAAGASIYHNLFDAASKGTADDIQNLIKSGADVNERDSRGRTPLMFAARDSSSPSVIDALVKAGAKVNVRDDIDNSTPLLYAAEHNRSYGIINALLRNGANVHMRNHLGQNALSLARIHNSQDAVGSLLSAGAR